MNASHLHISSRGCWIVHAVVVVASKCHYSRRTGDCEVGRDDRHNLRIAQEGCVEVAASEQKEKVL